MSAPREVVQTAAPWSSLPTAAAWLLGYVRTDAPGYREHVEDGALLVVAGGEHRFDAFAAAAYFLSPEDPSKGQWYCDGYAALPASVTFPDRTGWLLGFGSEEAPTTTDGIFASRFIPPAGIPLIGATWKVVTDDADRRQLIDRHRRNQGYVWGSALLVRCSMVMHRYALEALQTGWCLRGKVTLGCADMLDTPFDSTEPRGAITGYALGLDSVSWLDSIQQNARVEMTIVIQ